MTLRARCSGCQAVRPLSELLAMPARPNGRCRFYCPPANDPHGCIPPALHKAPSADTPAPVEAPVR
ncbi:hypothetical protein BH24CHL6_BH24CHL6_08730 [soil metagenome]